MGAPKAPPVVINAVSVASRSRYNTFTLYGVSKLTSLMPGRNRNDNSCNDSFRVGRNDCANMSSIVRALRVDSDADAFFNRLAMC